MFLDELDKEVFKQVLPKKRQSDHISTNSSNKTRCCSVQLENFSPLILLRPSTCLISCSSQLTPDLLLKISIGVSQSHVQKSIPEFQVWSSFVEIYVIFGLFLAALIAEENLGNITELILLLQRKEEDMKEGFEVIFKGQEYIFLPEFLDRYEQALMLQCSDCKFQSF